MNLNILTEKIIGAAITVHKELGPGLLESVYQTCMFIELESILLKVCKEVALPVMYRNQIVSDNGFRIDLLVEDLIIVELKSVESIAKVYKKQVLTHLKLTGLKLGYLLNFGEEFMKDGISRIVNGKIQ